MSYTTDFELNIRNSKALDILNDLRHVLIGRRKSLNPEFKKILLKSLDLSKSDNVVTSDYILYSLHGLNNYEEASALELSDILHETSDQNVAFKAIPDQIREFLNSESDSNTSNLSEITTFINSCMDSFYITITNKGNSPAILNSL